MLWRLLLLCLFCSITSAINRLASLPTTPTTQLKSKPKSKLSQALIAFKQANQAAIIHGLHGAFAGGVQVVCLMWLRTVVNYQYRYGVSMTEAVSALYKAGGVARFYRGMPLALIQNPLLKFGAVAANEASKALVLQLCEQMHSDVYFPLLSSTLSTLFSIFWKLFLVPVETMKTVLQVDGSAGFQHLWSDVVQQGRIGRLYAGSQETILSTVLSHYPWFYVHNLLDHRLQPAHDARMVICRAAFIGFVASAVSDCVSNILRVLKTLKQTDSSSIVLQQLRQHEYGWWQLATRGLGTRILVNGVQSVVFLIAWKMLPMLLKRRKSEQEQEKQQDVCQSSAKSECT